MNNERIYDFTNIILAIKSYLSYAKFSLGKLLVTQPKFALYTSISAVIIAIVCIFTLESSSVLNAQSDHVNNKYYRTVAVETGDTLWSIAEENRTVEYATMSEYISEVKEINHLSDDTITSGCYLTIPYYADRPIQE